MQLLPEVSFDHLPPLSQSHILRLDAVLQRCTFPASCQIRDASIADAPALNDIFNDIVKSTMALSWVRGLQKPFF